MLISISGPSKSGKTVFVRSVVGGENLISITASGASSAAALWQRVFHMIGTPALESMSISDSETEQQSATVGAGIRLPILSAKGDKSEGASTTKGEIKRFGLAVDPLQLLIKELANSGMVIFIDDFHYLSDDVQLEVAQHIKEAIANGVSIVCASVPYHSEDVLRANSDLRGRVVTIDFDYWDESTLIKVGELGFPELNMDVDSGVIHSFAKEAAGSPQLMQSICLNFCYEGSHRERSDSVVKFTTDKTFFENVCVRTAVNADYSSTIERLREGPKTRGTDRIQHRLKNGDVGDVYTILLQAISSDPPLLHFRYSGLTERIRAVVEDSARIPVGSSVTGACAQLATLANDSHSRAVIEWDSKEDALHIRDPYLLFYMRWSGTIRPF